jgi:two-component system cell cycle response regulator DivK
MAPNESRTPSTNANERRECPVVLIVDDNDDNRELYAGHLPGAGFRVLTAVDGAEAVEKARAERPDIIVLDLAMPGTNGWDAARILKSDVRTESICVMALTGHTDASHYVSAKLAGCDYFLAKPCLPEDLVAHIEAWLVLRRGL